MRWKGIIVFGVLFVLIMVGWWIFSDSIFSGSIESVGSSVNGARVDVKELSFSLLDLSVDIKGLEIGDPDDEWNNQLEIRNMRFKIAPLPLLYGKINIEEMAAEGIMQNTKRTTSAKLPKAKEEPVTEPDEMVPLWKILHIAGADWTYGTKGWAAENYCMFMADLENWEKIVRTKAKAVDDLGCKVWLNTE